MRAFLWLSVRQYSDLRVLLGFILPHQILPEYTYELCPFERHVLLPRATPPEFEYDDRGILLNPPLWYESYDDNVVYIDNRGSGHPVTIGARFQMRPLVFLVLEGFVPDIEQMLLEYPHFHEREWKIYAVSDVYSE